MMWKNVPEYTKTATRAHFCVFVSVKLSSVTLTCSCSVVSVSHIPYSPPSVFWPIVQPVSNSWHYCKCQSSIEATCFLFCQVGENSCSPGWWTFVLRSDRLFCCYLLFLTVCLLAPIQVTPSWTRTTCLVYRISITIITLGKSVKQ